MTLQLQNSRAIFPREIDLPTTFVSILDKSLRRGVILP
jgi:hypothetical protein